MLLITLSILCTGNAYGWGVAENNAVLSYICEIDQSQAYKIVQELRDFGESLQSFILEKADTLLTKCILKAGVNV